MYCGTPKVGRGDQGDESVKENEEGVVRQVGTYPGGNRKFREKRLSKRRWRPTLSKAAGERVRIEKKSLWIWQLRGHQFL